MPRLAAGSAFIRASRRCRAMRSERNSAYTTARLAATADLMASGGQFVMPHLDGIPAEHRFHAGEHRFDWPGR